MYCCSILLTSRKLLVMFSVIIPMYNAADYVLETLQSISCQSFEKFEVIIVDDRSTDDSYNIVKQFITGDERFSLYRLEVNSGGPARPRNFAIERAQYDYVLFCDSDDLWHRDKLAVTRQFLKSAEILGIDFCIIGCRFKSFSSGNEMPRLDRPLSGLGKFATLDREAFRYRNQLGNSGVLARRSDIVRVGGLNEDPQLVAVEDYDLWIRIITATKRPALKLQARLVHYRVIATSISANKKSMYEKAVNVQRAHFLKSTSRPQRILDGARYAIGAVWERLDRM